MKAIQEYFIYQMIRKILKSLIEFLTMVYIIFFLLLKKIDKNGKPQDFITKFTSYFTEYNEKQSFIKYNGQIR